ncbi:ubiquitin-conjugating enzyme E2 J1 [Agrilus planipennis]|uniref:Ubiquitin-conjugating enzyme E2 J1 n=1 Tax=Agrilus planipennis TaxID=224129 RepID=A0A1W4WA37_AGRPL|nr:ubiquitin-conjugating enzyme E2 J1 [Agrilus planipennis]
MSVQGQYNLKSPGVKRLMREARELAEPTEEYYASPLDDNLFEWHFTVKGPEGTEFEGGYYHGRILLPSQYPMQPPNIILLTPNGRFETNKKICLSISGYHPESWQPSWSIRTALLALIAFMPTPAAGTIGSLEYTKEERQILAKKSVDWVCDTCGKISTKLATASLSGTKQLTKEESTLIQQIALKSEEETVKSNQRKNSESDVNIRQRIPVSRSEYSEASNADSLLQTSIERSNKDKLWFAIIWTIITLITLLVVRRVFFL